MPSFQDNIFILLLALLLLGPKRLPKLARELGKWIGEFRRASNEFKMQMNEEMRVAEQDERRQQIAAMEAAAPVTPALAEPASTAADPVMTKLPSIEPIDIETPVVPVETVAAQPAGPLPIATSGELSMMPPATGLPVARDAAAARAESPDALGGLLEAIPVVTPEAAPAHLPIEVPAHAD